jgi:hypothetical protein
MADNISVASKTIATDEVSIAGATVHVQRLKLGFGDDGTYTGDVSRAVPLPVDAALNTGVIQSSGSQLTPKFAKIALTATGTLVAAVSGKKIRVLSLFMTIEQETADETYIFNSGASGTALTGSIGDTTTGDTTRGSVPVSLPFSPIGWFETASGALLELALAGTTPIAHGCLVYVEV